MTDIVPRGTPPPDAEALARTCAEQVLVRLFERLNIDITDRDEVRELGRDMQFLRVRRETAEDRALRRRTAMWTSTATAFVSALGVLLTWFLNHGKSP